jgi:hypothetical protein
MIQFVCYFKQLFLLNVVFYFEYLNAISYSFKIFNQILYYAIREALFFQKVFEKLFYWFLHLIIDFELYYPKLFVIYLQ